MFLEDFKKVKIGAMKNHDKTTVDTMNIVINKLMLLTIEKRKDGVEILEADVVKVLKKTESELIEERDAFEKAGRSEEVSKLDAQIECVKQYLPELMSKEKIAEIIGELDDKSVPAVMKHFKVNFAGKCDMKDVNEVLRNLK